MSPREREVERKRERERERERESLFMKQIRRWGFLAVALRLKLLQFPGAFQVSIVRIV